MWKTDACVRLLVIVLFVTFLPSFIDGRRLENRNGLKNRLHGQSKTSHATGNVNRADQLAVPCTDCEEKDGHSAQHKIRHAHSKKVRNSRNFNGKSRNTSPDSSNVSLNHETPLQILFRTYVNGFKTAEWLSHQAETSKGTSGKSLKPEVLNPTNVHQEQDIRKLVKSEAEVDQKTETVLLEKSEVRGDHKPETVNLVKPEVEASKQSETVKLIKPEVGERKKPETGIDDIIDIDADPVNQLEDVSNGGSYTGSDTLVDDDPKTLEVKEERKHKNEAKHEKHSLQKSDKAVDSIKVSDTRKQSSHGHHDHKHRKHQKKGRSGHRKKTQSLKQIIKAYQKEDSLRLSGGQGQKLFNQLQEPVRSMIYYMEQLDQKVLARSRQTSLMSDSAINSTRYVMMVGAREIIQDVINVNNDVYKVVVDASDLTRDIYRRSHARQTSITPLEPMTNISSMGINNGITFQDISKDLQKVQKLYNKVKMMKMKSQQELDRVLQIREKLDENRGRDELKDLIYHANQTTAKLDAEFRTSLAIRKYDRYKNVITDIHLLTQEANLLVKKGREEIMQSTKNTRGNLMYRKNTRRRRQVNSSSGSAYSSTDRAQLLPVIREASNHARHLEESAAQIKRKFEPLINEAKTLEGFSPGSSTGATSTRYLSTRIITNVKGIYNNLNGIRHHIDFKPRLPIYCVFSNDTDINCIGEEKEEEGCIEGSTCDLIEEGSAVDLDGSSPDTDSEFEFVDVTDTTNTGQLLTAAEFDEFGVQLKNQIKTYKEKNEITLNLARNVSQIVKDTALDWNSTKRKLESTVYEMKQISDFRESWHQQKTNFSQATNKVSGLSTSVAASLETTKNKCRLALEKSAKMVKLVQAISDGSSNNAEEIDGSADDDYIYDDDEDNNGESGIDVSTLSDKVQKTKDDLNVLNRVRQKTPILCENIQDRISKMTSAISSLKEKVNRARLVMSSMKLPVIINDTSYIQSEIEDRSNYPSVVTEIEVCMKPATENGVVLMVVGNNSDSYMLEMKDGFLQFVLKDVDKYEKATLSADGALDLNKWYTVKIKRVGQTMSMWVNTTDGENKNKVMASPDTQFYQPDPGAVYIGGAPAGVISSGYFATDDFSWKGCISGLMINGKIVSTYLENHQKENPKPCKTNCKPPSAEEPSMRFSGDGYVEFPAKYFYRHPRVTSVSLEFRSGQNNAFLMSIHHQGERFRLEVTISSGQLVIKTTTPSESILLRTTKTFNDNILHTIKISYRDSTTYPEVDSVDGLFSINSQPRMSFRRDGILLGGVPTLSSSVERATDLPPNLIGCLRNLRINDKHIGTSAMTSYDNVHIGPCQAYSIWDNCVTFSDASFPVEILNRTEINLINLNIGRDSTGHLLQYEKTSKFNLTLEVKDAVLHIKEDVKDVTADIEFPPNITFIPIVIQDKDSKSLVITSLNEERTISYSSGIWGFWDSDDEDEIIYNIRLGLRDGDPGQTFTGDIAEFAVNSELQNLRSNNFRRNSLTACVRKDSRTLTQSKQIEFATCRHSSRSV